ncbi:MAG: hypothetical protein OEO84_08975 [Betaproteobacteria bacterium]|nr:hypothetical protein [Betaproteobacteria bacterium]
MNTRNNLTRGRAALWTKDKIDLLTTPEVRNLHANAERLLETEIAALCIEVLGARPRTGVTAPAKPEAAPRAKRAKVKQEQAA